MTTNEDPQTSFYRDVMQSLNPDLVFEDEQIADVYQAVSQAALTLVRKSARSRGWSTPEDELFIRAEIARLVLLGPYNEPTAGIKLTYEFAHLTLQDTHEAIIAGLESALL